MKWRSKVRVEWELSCGNGGMQGPLVAVSGGCTDARRGSVQIYYKVTNLCYMSALWLCRKLCFEPGTWGPCSNKNYLLFVHFRGLGSSHD